MSLIDTPNLTNLPSELEMFDRLAEETQKEIGVNTYSDASQKLLRQIESLYKAERE